MTAVLVHLRVNGLASPTGVSDSSVRLSWTAPEALADGDTLTVTAASTLPGLLAGDPSTQVAQVTALSPTTRQVVIPTPVERIIHWRVGVCRDHVMTWSEPGRFTTAPDLSALGAAWITHPQVASGRAADDARTVWFATRITSLPTDSATLLHLAAPGVVEVRVDGALVDGSLLGPGYCDLLDEAPAATYDLGVLEPGAHLVSVELASGPFWIPTRQDRYAKFTIQAQPPMLLAAIEQFGAVTTITTSGSAFNVGRGATVAAYWYGGEDHDTGLPEPWEDGEKVGAVAVDTGDQPAVWWPQFPPLAVTEVLEPIRVWSAADGAIVYDFGTNIAGLPELTWAKAGLPQAITLHPSEVLHEATVNQDSTGTPIFDTITIPANTAGSWRPRFAYHGFRYVEMRGARSPEPTLRALVVRAGNERSGDFAADERFLNSLHRVVDRAVQGNMFSVFTDCPHREKLGWLEQLHLCFDAIARNYDVEAHLRDVLHHVRHAQLASGAIPNIAPEFVDFTGHGFLGDDNAFRFDVNWGGVIVLLPLYHYHAYGDRRVLTENVSAMKRYLAHLADLETDGSIDFGLGDWVSLNPRAPRRLVATHGYLRVLRGALGIARVLADTAWGLALAERIEAVAGALKEFDVTSPHPSQTELALLVDLADASGDQETGDDHFARLLQRIDADGGAFTVGEVALEPLVNALHRRGLDDLTYRTISRTDVPGYGMQLSLGVTALAETWSAARGPEGEGSNNHFMLGMIDHWLHRHIAGLRQADDSVGWQRAVIEPVFLTDLPAASSWYRSPLGRYAIEWERGLTGEVTVVVTIPPGGLATVILPGLALHEVSSGVHSYVRPAEPTAAFDRHAMAEGRYA